MNATTKILIIGGGSIGQRHLKNLLFLGYKNISLVETSPERAEDLAKKFNLKFFSSAKEALEKEKFQTVFVCAPTVYHLQSAAMAAKAGCDLFVEKPLSHNLDGVEKLVKTVKEKKLITMVGSNWKFYPLFQKMKELLTNGAIGRVFSARCQFGQYLPDWHPEEDYRRGYSANKKLGGGILLDSHEFDYLTWFMGEAVKLSCLSIHSGLLETDTEDAAEIILEFKSGAIGEIHLDYLQRFYQRNFEFFGSEGTIKWDFASRKVILQNKNNGQQEFPLAPDYDLNDMYIEEAKHFLDSVEQRKETIAPVDFGAKVLRLIMAAKESSAQNKTISL